MENAATRTILSPPPQKPPPIPTLSETVPVEAAGTMRTAAARMQLSRLASTVCFYWESNDSTATGSKQANKQQLPKQLNNEMSKSKRVTENT